MNEEQLVQEWLREQEVESTVDRLVAAKNQLEHDLSISQRLAESK